MTPRGAGTANASRAGGLRPVRGQQSTFRRYAASYRAAATAKSPQLANRRTAFAPTRRIVTADQRVFRVEPEAGHPLAAPRNCAQRRW